MQPRCASPAAAIVSSSPCLCVAVAAGGYSLHLCAVCLARSAAVPICNTKLCAWYRPTFDPQAAAAQCMSSGHQVCWHAAPLQLRRLRQPPRQLLLHVCPPGIKGVGVSLRQRHLRHVCIARVRQRSIVLLQHMRQAQHVSGQLNAACAGSTLASTAHTHTHCIKYFP